MQTDRLTGVLQRVAHGPLWIAGLALGATLLLLMLGSASAGHGSTIDFNDLSAGATVTSVSSGSGISGPAVGGSVGISVTAPAPNFGAMVFDADCVAGGCSGDDPDLSAPAQEKVLIVSEDGIAGNPDDLDGANTIVFDFTTLDAGEVIAENLTVIDIDNTETGGTIVLMDGAVTLATIPILTNGNGGLTVVNLGSESGVTSLIVNFAGSGAVDDLEFFIPADEPEGWMTGGGTVQLEGRGRSANAQFITHGFIIRCDGSHARFEYQDHNVDGGGNFHLENVTSVVCIDDPALDPFPPKADFDTLTLVGDGRWNGVSGATVEVTLTDNRQPGKTDTIDIVVMVGATEVSKHSAQTLNSGNHQAH